MIDVSVELVALTLVAYLIGSLSAAIIVCKLMGLPDPRSQGSKNPGATNVLRYGGKKAAAITLLGDALKGFLPVLAAKLMGQGHGNLEIIAMAAFLGHLYPVFFQFQGGKGVATALGVFLAMSLPVSLSMLATWLIMAFVFNISSLAALTAACLAPVFVWYWEPNAAFITMSMVLSVMLIWRHRSNIKNLIKGLEGKIKE
ncbi:MAG: glycerol-3-phosphate 1-O-acyltransferase PlsY [Gammaproteobacteria bacterium]|jgi:glycerol-3-phosphate acyltransferase PlsY|nr:glycerol-3-phosphate 1-O-acyltransferase PlsY [Gammaproteobacteria bacterium]